MRTEILIPLRGLAKVSCLLSSNFKQVLLYILSGVLWCYGHFRLCTWRQDEFLFRTPIYFFFICLKYTKRYMTVYIPLHYTLYDLWMKIWLGMVSLSNAQRGILDNVNGCYGKILLFVAQKIEIRQDSIFHFPCILNHKM